MKVIQELTSLSLKLMEVTKTIEKLEKAGYRVVKNDFHLKIQTEYLIKINL